MAAKDAVEPNTAEYSQAQVVHIILLGGVKIVINAEGGRSRSMETRGI
jgi:hypothetical protein